MGLSMLSLACEVQDCSFRTPSIDEEHFPALVKLLEIHSVSVHGLDVGASSAARTVLEAPGPRGRSGNMELGVREAPGARPGQGPGYGESMPSAREGEEPDIDEGQQGVVWRERARDVSGSSRTELAFPCPDCRDKSYNSAAGLHIHRTQYCLVSKMKSRRKRELPFPCPDCRERSFNSAPGLNIHRTQYCPVSEMRDRKAKLAFPCPDCHEKSYNTVTGLHQHRTSYCPVSKMKGRRMRELTFPCPDCREKSFNTAAGLLVHRTYHCQVSEMKNREKTGHPRSKQTRVDLPFLCQHCKECSYTSAEGLNQHVKKFCEASKEAAGQQGVSGESLSERSKSAKRDLPFPCPECQEFSYATAAGLLQHRARYCRMKREGSGDQDEAGQKEAGQEEARHEEAGQEGSNVGTQGKRDRWKGRGTDLPFFLCPACGESSFSDVDSFLLHRAMYCRKVRRNDDMSRESKEKENLPEAALVIVGTGEDTSIKNKSINSGGKQSQVNTSDTDGRNAKSTGSDPEKSSAALSKVVIQVHCPDGPEGKEVRASYRLSAKTAMGKVVQKVAAKLSVSPASVVLTAGGEVVEAGQEAASYRGRIVTAHLMIDYDMEVTLDE